MEININIKGNTYLVKVSLKKMKQVRLKVFPSGEIRLSAPLDTPREWIEKYLSDKTSWINEKLDMFIQTKAIEKEEHFSSGTSTRILGRQMTVEVTPSNKKQIVIEDGTLKILTFENEQYRIDNQVNNWWQQSSRCYYQQVVEKLYPIIGKHGIEKPKVCVKKMNTLWGSCSRKKVTINLNFYLYKASAPCIEYVIFTRTDTLFVPVSQQ